MSASKNRTGKKRLRPNSDRSVAISMVVVAIVLAIFAGVYLWLVNQNIDLADELWDNHMELNAIRNRNIELRMEIARESSIQSLIERSYELGFEPAKSVEFMQEP